MGEREVNLPTHPYNTRLQREAPSFLYRVLISLYQGLLPSAHFTCNFPGEVGGGPSLIKCLVCTKVGYTVLDCKGLGMMGSEMLSFGDSFEIGNVWRCEGKEGSGTVNLLSHLVRLIYCLGGEKEGT